MTQLFAGRWSVSQRDERRNSPRHSNVVGWVDAELGPLDEKQESRPLGISLKALPLETPLRAGDHVEVTVRIVKPDPLYNYPSLKTAD